MCIAILLPPKKYLDKDTLKRCNSSNPDGFGFAYFDRELVIRKEVEKEKIQKSIDSFIKIRKQFKDRPFLVHFRIATHGKISTRCCHPFRVNEDVVFCHNGILKYEYGVDKNSLDSDTMMFNKNILQKIDNRTLNDMINSKKSVLKDLLEGYIGSGNKMILLNKEGNYCILNEYKGLWDKGIWYSNDSYKKKEDFFSYGYGNYYGYNYNTGYLWQDEQDFKTNTTKKWYKGDWR